MANAFLSVNLRAGGSRGVSQRRYMHREWNKRSPRVRKYHSVPVLRLIPPDRPLFFCENCCSGNLYVPICLWCKWTSAAAMKNFEEKAPRTRSMSAPRSCSIGLGRGSNLKARLRGEIVGLGPRGSLDTDRSTEPPETPRSASHDNDSSAIAATDEWIKFSGDEATMALPAGSTQPFCDPYHGGRARLKNPYLSAVNVDNSRGSIVSSNRSAHIPWSDDGHTYESHSFFSDDGPQGFRRSSDSRRSGTKSEGHVPRLARSPTRTRNPIVQSSPPPPFLHRRPLYHYIRNKASDSQSTFDCGAVPGTPPSRPVTPQHAASHFPQRSTETTPACVDGLGRAPLMPSIAPFSRKGFSLSGETEQSMDLARMVHDGRFIFHESKPARKRDRIMLGLRRSFKSFFNNKVDG